MFVTIRIIKIL